MKYLYHGSSKKGVKRLEPRRSTHGTYVYATPYKELAVIFSSRCGDDYTYALYRNKKTDPWVLVERIPEGFNTMFNNSSSIYTISGDTFEDIHTGFAEVVSKTGVDVLEEENLENVYEKIKQLKEEGKIKLYTYPNKPKEIKEDSSDLIKKVIKQAKREKRPVTKQNFDRLVLMHPQLMSKINSKMKELDLKDEPYKKEDLIDLFEQAVIRQRLNKEYEQYLKSIIIMVSKYFNDLLPKLKDKLKILKMSDEELVPFLIDRELSFFNDIPDDIINSFKESYLNDERELTEKVSEIYDCSNRLWLINRIINKRSAITQDNIILIVRAVKSDISVAKKLGKKLHIPVISLDLGDYIDHKKPIVDYKIKELIKMFKNKCILASSKIAEEDFQDLGLTNVVYIDDKDIDEITDLIAAKVSINKKIQKN